MRFVNGFFLVLAFVLFQSLAHAAEPLPAKYRLKFSVIERQYTPDGNKLKEEKVIAVGTQEFQTLTWSALEKTGFGSIPSYELFYLKSQTQTEGYTVGGMLATGVRNGRKELTLQIDEVFPTKDEKTNRIPLAHSFTAKSESKPELSATITLSLDTQKKFKRTLEFEVEILEEKAPR